MLPALDPTGYLPPGIHEAAWDELEAMFGRTSHRRRLLDGLYRAAVSLRDAGCARLYVDGSFVTSKHKPRDFDGCWEPHGVDSKKLDPVLLDFSNKRAAQIAKYGGELFPSSARAEAPPGRRTFLEFFRQDSLTGQDKGIVAIDLRKLP